jgi:hypothetical protein
VRPMARETNRPQIQTLACPYEKCQLYAQKDQIRLLRCSACCGGFSERKNTALFDTKICEQKAVSVTERLSEGVSTKETSRLVGVSPEAVRRLRSNLGTTQERSMKPTSRTSRLPQYGWTNATGM